MGDARVSEIICGVVNKLKDAESASGDWERASEWGDGSFSRPAAMVQRSSSGDDVVAIVERGTLGSLGSSALVEGDKSSG
jgi:hypothetical protein